MCLAQGEFEAVFQFLRFSSPTKILRHAQSTMTAWQDSIFGVQVGLGGWGFWFFGFVEALDAEWVSGLVLLWVMVGSKGLEVTS